MTPIDRIEGLAVCILMAVLAIPLLVVGAWLVYGGPGHSSSPYLRRVLVFLGLVCWGCSFAGLAVWAITK